MRTLVIDLDALGDTRPLWDAWLADAGRVLPVPASSLDRDRVRAAAQLDAASAGNWRVLLERFAEDHAPVYLRPAPEVSAALRRLAASGTRLGLVTDAPEELARVAAAHLGASRRVEVVAAGADALDVARAALGADAPLVSTRAELIEAAGAGGGPAP